MDPMEDENFSVYLDVLEQHRDQPFIRLTAYGVLDFLAAVTGGGVLRFERDGQPSDTPTPCNNGNGAALTKMGEVRRQEFGEVLDACGPKASIAPAADGPWEDFEEKPISLQAASLNAIQLIAYSIPGVLSFWITAGKQGKIFRLLTGAEIKTTTDLQKRVVVE